MRQIAIVLTALLVTAFDAGVAMADRPDGYQQRNAWAQKHRKVRGGPPPWAPAHGYRRKHGSHGYGHDVATGELPRPAIDLNVGRCQRDMIGGAIGAGAGAAIGSTIGDGDERRAAIAAGAVIGTIVGGAIGRAMDEADQACVGRALEYAEDGQAIEWASPENDTYQVVPTRTYQVETGQYCREYRTQARIGGTLERVYGRACRQPDGSWELVS